MTELQFNEKLQERENEIWQSLYNVCSEETIKDINDLIKINLLLADAENK